MLTSSKKAEEPLVGKSKNKNSKREAATEKALLFVSIYIWCLLCVTAMDYTSLMLVGPDRIKYFLWSNSRPVTAILFVLVFLLVGAITSRLRDGAATVFFIAVGLGTANVVKIKHRGEPLAVADFAFILEPDILIQFGSVQLVALIIGILLGSIFLCYFVLNKLSRTVFFPHRIFRGRTKKILLIRAIVAAICASLLWQIPNFHKEDNWIKASYELAGTSWQNWDRSANAVINGLIPTALSEINVPIMEKPEGYSVERMNAIEAKYTEIAREHNSQLDENIKPNVLLILDESFIDLDSVEGLEFDEDPISYTNKLRDEGYGGDMASLGYGGGTANVEFEALTGQAKSNFHPLVSYPYINIIPKVEGVYPSFVEYYNGLGYETLGEHPFRGKAYYRENVYKKMNFARAKFLEDLRGETARLGRFTSDSSLFAAGVEEIKKTDKPLFINMVTMQNHVPHEEKHTEIDFKENGGPASENLENYGSSLKKSDEAIKELISDLTALEEPTVVLLYGDHWPGVVLDDVKDKNTKLEQRTTPYILWSNYKQAPPELPPLTSSLHFQGLLADYIDAPWSPHHALLATLYETISGSFEEKFILRETGEIVSREKLPAETQQALEDLLLLQYDYTVGEGYAENMYQVPAS